MLTNGGNAFKVTDSDDAATTYRTWTPQARQGLFGDQAKPESLRNRFASAFDVELVVDAVGVSLDGRC